MPIRELRSPSQGPQIQSWGKLIHDSEGALSRTHEPQTGQSQRLECPQREVMGPTKPPACGKLISCLECNLTLVLRYLMARFSAAELKKFRDTSHCSACVHYTGCQLWLALLLMNEEFSAPGLELMVPDISKPCVMFFPWTSASIRRAPSESLDASDPSQEKRAH